VGSVCGKRRFLTRGAAEMARRSIAARDKAAGFTSSARELSICWCFTCEALHLGRKS
jgi:hypothetical protein